MYDHIGLRVADLDASVRFYTATLAPLGFELCSRDETGAGFGPKGAPALWLHLHEGKAGTGAQRPFTGLSSDAQLNLYDAVRVAASDEAKGKGVVVVTNGEINAARDVTNDHDTSTGDTSDSRANDASRDA